MQQNIYSQIGQDSPQLCVITAFQDIYDLATEAATAHDISACIILTPVDKEVETARNMLNQGVEVLIGRGQLVALLRNETAVPVIAVEVSTSDMLRCLLPFQNTQQTLGVLGFTGFADGIEDIAALLSVPMRRLEVLSLSDVSNVLDTAVAEGIEHILGSYGLVRKAQERGFNGIILRSGREAMTRAFDEAAHIITLRTRWREQAELVKSVFNATQDAIVSIDTEGRITCMNANAGQLFGMAPEAGISRQLATMLPSLKLSTLLRQSQNGALFGQITMQTGRRTAIVRHAPLYHHDAVVGAVVCVQDVTELQRLEQMARQKLHESQLLAELRLDDIVGDSAPMRTLKDMARKYACVDASVLVLGETGTGKELFAQGLHTSSTRAKGPFVAVNCAALPDQLLESELFGYEEGAFTGARRGGKAGLFELAHGGSIFLDEVGEMSLNLQARMLRVLQDRMVMRLGGNRLLPVDVRIIAATNRPIEALVAQGNFREDLFYRLNTLQLSIPPLRRHSDDIPMLVQHFLQKYAHLNPKVRGIDQEACALLERFHWPGNVRQLEHSIERAVIMCEGDSISLDAQLLPLMDKQISSTNPWTALDVTPVCSTPPLQASCPTRPQDGRGWQDIQHQLIRKTLEEQQYHKGNAAKILGISRATLWRKLQEMNKASQK